MLDLASLPRGAFASALEYNLERFESLPKVCDHFLFAVSTHLGADAAWLRRTLRENRPVAEDYSRGGPRLRDDARIESFLRNERPEVPRNLLLAPVKVNGRLEGVVGAERHGSDFERGQGWSLNRLATVLAHDLSRREEERLARVLDSIKGKVVSELRPRDLAYQILDGLHQLLHYDHSAALLLYDANRRLLRVEAEKIAWTKAKSAFIGHEVPLPESVAEALRSAAPVLTFPSGGGAGGELENGIFELLYFHRGEAIPEPTSILCAPLVFDDVLLGLLKLAARRRFPFDARDRKVAERFLPAAATALRNARERVTLENQALDAEVRAGLVTLARAIAHDVNNAMGSLLPLAEQVREDLRLGAADDATLVRDMDVVIEKASLCKRIFANMLKLGAARPGGGPIDVHAVVREMLPILNAQVGGRATLSLDLAEALPVVTFSRPHLERVLWNLVTNAADALSTAGGDVVVRTRLVPDEGVHLSVVDDGPGIPEDVLGRVMEPFFTTKENGSGLGLSICRALAWQGGGDLRIHSKVPEGTEAVLVLPLGVRKPEER
jgi:signal transduction histidine kinase